MTDVEQRVAALERQVHALRVQVQRHEEHVDTITSPLWKRLVWWSGGYYFRKVGRWYSEDTTAFRWWLWVAERMGCK